MGDSAGGGLAFNLAQALAADDRHADAVLISTFGDATVSDPRTPAYDRADPYVAAVGVRAVIGAWAGDDDPTRPEISPTFL